MPKSQESEFPVTKFVKDCQSKAEEAFILGPGFGVGFGCGVGFGVGLVGGAGYGGSGWNHINVGFGFGVGCGFGFGVGYGQGVGYGNDLSSLASGRKSGNGKRVVI